MEYTELLKEVERLKLQVAEYESKYVPVYEKHMASVKEKALAEYGLQNAEVWLARLTADTEEGIAEQVKQIAVDLRIQERNKPADPSGKGNGSMRSYKQTSPQEHGKRMYHRLADNGKVKDVNGRSGMGTQRTVVILPPAPTPKPSEQEKKRGIIARILGR